MTVFLDYDNGDVLKDDSLSIGPDTILANFANGLRNLAALSLESGYITDVAVPHLIANAFKNLAAIGLETDYKFKQIEGAGNAPAPVAAAPVAAAPVKAAVKEERNFFYIFLFIFIFY